MYGLWEGMERLSLCLDVWLVGRYGEIIIVFRCQGLWDGNGEIIIVFICQGLWDGMERLSLCLDVRACGDQGM